MDLGSDIDIDADFGELKLRGSNRADSTNTAANANVKAACGIGVTVANPEGCLLVIDCTDLRVLQNPSGSIIEQGFEEKTGNVEREIVGKKLA